MAAERSISLSDEISAGYRKELVADPLIRLEIRLIILRSQEDTLMVVSPLSITVCPFIDCVGHIALGTGGY